eukprot:13943069-Alexandrium_andersonii.AAC.1
MLRTRVVVRERTRALSTRVLRAEHACAKYARFGLRARNLRAHSMPRTLPSTPPIACRLCAGLCVLRARALKHSGSASGVRA